MAMIGLHPEIVLPDVDETPREGELPGDLVSRLAELKARAVIECRLSRERRTSAEQTSTEEQSEVVVAGDTVVALGDTILGKPHDRADAERMLRALRGASHHVYSGVAVAVVEPARLLVRTVETEVLMRDFSDDELAWYLDTDEWSGKAGSYGIQGQASLLISALRGDYYSVVGLPVSTVAELMAELGHPVTTWSSARRC